MLLDFILLGPFICLVFLLNCVKMIQDDFSALFFTFSNISEIASMISVIALYGCILDLHLSA